MSLVTIILIIISIISYLIAYNLLKSNRYRDQKEERDRALNIANNTTIRTVFLASETASKAVSLANDTVSKALNLAEIASKFNNDEEVANLKTRIIAVEAIIYNLQKK